MSKRTPKMLQKEYEIDMMKIEDGYVMLDQNGKYQTYILYENEPGGGMAYFLEDTGRRIRIHNSTFYRWLDEGKSVRVTPPEIWKN